MKKPAEEPTLEDSIRLDALAPDAKNTLIELDLGQRSVLLQAWNIANRDCWIKHLTDWSGLRRRTVENSVGFSSRSLGAL